LFPLYLIDLQVRYYKSIPKYGRGIWHRDKWVTIEGTKGSHELPGGITEKKP